MEDGERESGAERKDEAERAEVDGPRTKTEGQELRL